MTGSQMANAALMRCSPSHQISAACRAGGSVSDNLNDLYMKYSFKSDLEASRFQVKKYTDPVLEKAWKYLDSIK